MRKTDSPGSNMLLFLLLTQALELLLTLACFEADERLSSEVEAPGRRTTSHRASYLQESFAGVQAGLCIHTAATNHTIKNW